MAKILIVIPHDNFHDEEFTESVNILSGKGHKVMVGSSHHTEAHGHYGHLIKPDINVRFVETPDFEAILFIGGQGVDEYINDTSIMAMIGNYHRENKIVAALGRSVELLALAGVLSGKRVTCDTFTIEKVKAVGAYYTGGLAEEDSLIITGAGAQSAEAVCQKLLNLVQNKGGKGEIYARATRS